MHIYLFIWDLTECIIGIFAFQVNNESCKLVVVAKLVNRINYDALLA
jgi:hypothetical protein